MESCLITELFPEKFPPILDLHQICTVVLMVVGMTSVECILTPQQHQVHHILVQATCLQLHRVTDICPQVIPTHKRHQVRQMDPDSNLLTTHTPTEDKLLKADKSAKNPLQYLAI